MSKSSSNIVSFNLKNKTKDIQGGEKKVMKKSLSVVLSTAMALSMFSSVAFGKTSADFTDLKDLDAATKAKFDAMISAGIFDGVTDTTFGLKDEMNRAQFAKVAALITGIEVNKDLTTSSFSDVKADDSANGYALPYIEALKTAGITDGYGEGTYNPAGKVTKEQLATFLVRVLGKDAEAKAKTGDDKTVTDWAQGYVALALELKLFPATEGGFGGQSNATRDLLLTGAYEAKQQYVPAGKVSLTEAKATGVKTVTVSFNKPVDTEKAALALTYGTSAVTTTTKWSDDKKTATLTLTETSIRSGEYKVALSGLDAAGVGTATGSFTGQDETVQKIEFVSASDTIAYATNVVVKIKATNQYGENASASSGNYNTYGTVKLAKDADGFLLATVNTTGQQQGVGIVTVTLINNDSHVTATKNFKVGTAPILTKLELGAAKYSNGDAINGTGDNVKFALNLYDQYGSMMGYDALNIGAANSLAPTVIWNDFLDGATYVTEDDGNNLPVLKISLTKNVDKSADYNFTVIDQAASATGKLSIKSAKVATKIQIGQLDDVIAAGDTNVYVPVVAYDASGNQLSVEDLISTENLNRITISSNASSATKLVSSGENKGKILLNQIPQSKNSAVSINAFIATANVSSSDSKTFTVQAARIPDHLKEVTVPGKQLTPGGSTKFKYAVIDQYGKELDTLQKVDSQGNVSASGTQYAVTVSATTYANGDTTPTPVTTGATTLGAAHALVTGDSDAATANTAAIDRTGLNLTSDVKTALNDKTYRFAAINSAAAKGAKVELTITITKAGTEVSKLVRSISVVDANATELTYSLNSVATLWNAKDSGVVRDNVYDSNSQYTTGDVDGLGYISKVSQLQANSKFGREVTVAGKNPAGEVVGLPKTIQSISSSDTNIVNTYVSGGKAYVIGNKAGTAKVIVSFLAADGNSKTLTTDVTVKNDALNVASVSWDDKSYAITRANAPTTTFSAFLHVNVKDNYGVEYADATAQTYNYALGVTFAATNVKGGTVTIDQYGNVTVTPAAANAAVTFDLTVSSATGKSATTSYTIN